MSLLFDVVVKKCFEFRICLDNCPCNQPDSQGNMVINALASSGLWEKACGYVFGMSQMGVNPKIVGKPPKMDGL